MTDKSVDLEVILFFFMVACLLWLFVAVGDGGVGDGGVGDGGVVSSIVLRTFRFAPSLPHLRCGSLPLTAAGGQGPLGQHRLRPCTHPFLPSTALQPWLPAYGRGWPGSFRTIPLTAMHTSVPTIHCTAVVAPRLRPWHQHLIPTPGAQVIHAGGRFFAPV